MRATHTPQPLLLNRLRWLAGCLALAGLLAGFGGAALQAATPVASPTALGPVMPGFMAVAFNSTVCGGNLFTAQGGGSAGGTIFRDGGIFVNAPPDCTSSINFAGGGVEIATTTSATCPDINIPPDQPGGCILNGKPPIQVSGGQTEGVTCTPDAYPGGYINWWTSPRSPCNVYPAIQTQVPQMLTPTAPISVTDFTCGPARTTGSGGTLLPGTYMDGLNAGNNDVYLMPGVYCITGVAAGNQVLIAQHITGTGVFIYIQPPQATINYSGGGLNLAAATNCGAAPNAVPCALVGIALYKPVGPNACANGDQDISFSGNASLSVQGILWAPQSFFAFEGTGDLSIIGQSFMGCQKLTGNGVMQLDYTDWRQFRLHLPFVGN